MKMKLFLTSVFIGIIVLSCTENSPVTTNRLDEVQRTVIVYLSWSPPDDSVAFYKVERSIGSTQIWSVASPMVKYPDSTFIDSLSISDLNENEFHYRVYSAVTLDGIDYYSEPSAISSTQKVIYASN